MIHLIQRRRLLNTRCDDFDGPGKTFARLIKDLRLVILGVTICIGTCAQSTELSGTYVSPGLDVIVRFHSCDTTQDLHCGTLVWVWDQARTPHAAPGEQIVTDLQYDGTKWTGRLKNPENGRVYKGSAQLGRGGTLLMRGCAGPICVKQTWRSTQSIRRILNSIQ